GAADIRGELDRHRPDARLGLRDRDDVADAQPGRRPQQALRHQGRPLRERHAGYRAGPAELHAPLLRRGDAVRDLRHRGGLHLSMGGDLRRAGPLRVRRDDELHRPALRRLRLRLEEGSPGMGL
ncbi:MAG: NADH ubiquinone oxidoreductase chain A, partial [uncultured Thermomicrobiales bacterium]